MSLLTFAVQVIVARSLPPSSYGLFVLAMTVVYLVETIHRGLVTVPYMVLCQDMAGDAVRRLRGNMLLETIVLSTVGSFLLVLLAAVGSNRGVIEAVSVEILIGVAVAALALMLRGLTRTFLLAELRVDSALRLSLVSAGLTLALLTGAYVSEIVSVPSALLIVGVGSLVPVTVWLIINRSRLRLGCFVDDVVRAARYGRWITLSVLFNAIGIRAIPWLLAFMATADDVAVFAAVATVAGLANPVVNGLFAYVTPRLLSVAEEGGKAQALARGSQLFKVSLIFVPLYGLGMWFVGDGVVSLFFSDQYTGHGIVLSILAMEVAIKGANLVQVSMLRVARMPRMELAASMIGSIGCFLVGVMLIPQFGVLGAAIAVLVGMSLVLLFNHAALTRTPSADA